MARHIWRLQKYLRPRQHSTKKGCLRHQAINLTPKQGLIKRYLMNVPPDGRVWHKAFFKWVWVQGRGPDASSSSKNASNTVSIPLFRCQVINLTPPMWVKTWGDGPLRFEEINHPAQMPDSLLSSLCTKQGLIKVYSYSQWEAYIGSLLHSCKLGRLIC